MQETSDVGRSILAALQNTKYFKITHQAGDVDELDAPAGVRRDVCSLSTFRRDFERELRRGDRPSLLMAADATDPAAAGIRASTRWTASWQTALENEPRGSRSQPAAVPGRDHRRYNPDGSPQLNIVPGLLGDDPLPDPGDVHRRWPSPARESAARWSACSPRRSRRWK